MAAFERDGFVVIPQVVAPDMCDRLRAATIAAVEEDWRRYQDLPGKQRFIALDLTHLDPLFVQFLEEPGLVSIFDELLGPHWTLYSMTSTLLHPGEHPYTANIHNETVRVIEGYLTSALMTLSLDDFTVENGATWYLPGSHHRDRPTEEEFYADAVQVTRKRGDAVIFHPRVWHAGGENDTGEVRAGITVYGCRPWMKQRFDFPQMLGDDILDHVGETGRRILGFDARLPAAMDEFYRPPEQRLYRAGQD